MLTDPGWLPTEESRRTAATKRWATTASCMRLETSAAGAAANRGAAAPGDHDHDDPTPCRLPGPGPGPRGGPGPAPPVVRPLGPADGAGHGHRHVQGQAGHQGDHLVHRDRPPAAERDRED